MGQRGCFINRFRVVCLALLLLLTLGAGDLVRAAEPFDPGDDPFAEEESRIEIADPLEPLNRGVFWVNDKLYFYLFKPVARAYRVVPRPVRTSVGNFFTNLGFPIRFVSNLLQFKPHSAAAELDRFMVNSIFGLAGLFDTASHISDYKLPDPAEDLGQSFGYYGVGNGFYLVLPILGPSSLRDGVGTAGESFLDPWSYMNLSWPERGGIKAWEMTNWLSLDKDTYEQIKQDAIDPYLFIRNAYVQRRQAQIAK